MARKGTSDANPYMPVLSMPDLPSARHSIYDSANICIPAGWMHLPADFGKDV